VTVRFRRIMSLLLLVGAAPLSAQVVGHLPSESPFTDATGRHTLSGYLGHMSSVNDPAGVGPKSSLLVALEYEYDFPSAFLLTTRVGMAPFAERNVLDPLFTGPQRNLGTRAEPLVFIDGGISASLTGEKAWHGVAPRIFTNVGFIGSTNGDFDIGQYRFGPKFTFSYGVNLRGVTGKDWEWRADLSRLVYRIGYPGSYTGDGGVGDESIIGTGRQNPWTSQTMLSIGIARLWGR
jgi:hypothetical protein